MISRGNSCWSSINRCVSSLSINAKQKLLGVPPPSSYVCDFFHGNFPVYKKVLSVGLFLMPNQTYFWLHF